MSRDSEADPQAAAPGGAQPGAEPGAAPAASRWVHHLADLARLRLDDAEAEALAGDLDAVLDYVRRLAAFTGEEAGAVSDRPTPDLRPPDLPSPHPCEADDAVEPGLPRPVFLANAPRTADGLLCVPAVHPAAGRRAGRSDDAEEDDEAQPREAAKDGE